MKTPTINYKRLLAAVLYNSDETTDNQKAALYQKYGDIVKVND